MSIRHPINVIARNRVLSMAIVAMLSFGGSWLWSLFRGVPTPYNTNEFSYLLAADTFAHGRVTNQPHPLWVSFETIHVLQQPSYMSKYPPSQGFFLALGKILGGHPIFGVWLSAALMCAGTCWMLYAWVSPLWALLGGLVTVLQFGVFTYWSQSYWGGAVAAFGGALVFGALPRILKAQRVRDAIWLGVGLTLLANSRPLEGFLIAIPVACLTLPWKISREKIFSPRFFKNIILPVSIILFLSIAGMGIYNKKITGNAFEFPHRLYAKEYLGVPLLIWQPLSPVPPFHNITMQQYKEGWEERYYLNKRTTKGFIQDMEQDTRSLFFFFFGYPLAIPSLVIVLLMFRRRQEWVFFFGVAMIILGACAAPAYDIKVHYFAPLTSLAVLLISLGLRASSCLKFNGKRIGLMAVILLMFFQLGLNAFLTPLRPVVKSLARVVQGSSIGLPVSFTREELKNLLLRKGGKYLIVVKYPLNHIYHWEWVYNDADIDHSPIVWARFLDSASNASLLAYFKNRQVLYINVYWDLKMHKSFEARF